jgi:hypothetical protein
MIITQTTNEINSKIGAVLFKVVNQEFCEKNQRPHARWGLGMKIVDQLLMI